MRFAMELAEGPGALGRAAAAALAALGDPAHLLLSFPTHPFPAGRPAGPGAVPSLGCQVRGLWQGSRGWIRAPAALAVAAHLPGISLRLLQLRAGVVAGPDAPPAAWRQVLGLAGADPAALLLFATVQAGHLTPLLPGLASAFPGLSCAGAVAGQASRRPATGELSLEGSIPASDAAGLSLSGPIRLDTAVLHCWRALGPPHRITGTAGGELTALDGRPVGEILHAEAGPEGEGLIRARELLVEVGCSPPGLPPRPLPAVRTALAAPGRLRVLGPEEPRPGVWIRFCRVDAEAGASRAEALAAPPLGPEEGMLLISGLEPNRSPGSPDPVPILARPHPPSQVAALLVPGQIASGPDGETRLLGLSLVAARLGPA